MTPTIGRIVHYRMSDYDVSCANAGPFSKNPVRAGDVLPAVVVATHGTSCVNLKVLLDGHGDYWATSRVEGDGPGQWFWPPRV